MVVGRAGWLIRVPRRREKPELGRDLEAVGKQIASPRIQVLRI